ncbi:hypothetical protein PROH_16095 [Prochlorothrix hollandica PCC 9006 = CALU 1027]|uniref:2TM domain-containing protein n=2 Tax=Prochlorothrix hollandica TaxID=1223 RepID=A0A0M2PRT3_PROHO|nr:hypothetical protein PROH_16095 [Prochlorothrix hollandica PCC 9006 = CALU 1027]
MATSSYSASVSAPNPDIYSQEAVQQILQLAMAKKGDGSDGFSRSQLQEMAVELGIDPDDLQWAEGQWQEVQGIVQEQQVFAQEQRQRWNQNCIKFAIVNGFLVALDWSTGQGGHLQWSVVILLLWGMGFSLNTWKTFQLQGEAYDRRFQQWRLRKQLKKSVKSLVQQVVDRIN